MTLPKRVIFTAIFVCLLASGLFGQVKPAGEVDITKCWVYKTPDSDGRLIAADGSRVFLGLAGAKIEAIALDGKLMWRSVFGGEIVSNLLPLDSGLFLVTSTVSTDATKPGGSVLRSISKETGITNWTLKLPDADNHVISAFNATIIVVSKSGVIESVGAKTGLVRWKRELANGFAGEPAFDVSRAYVATTAKQIFGVSLASGEIDSMRKVAFDVTSIGETSNGDIVTGDDHGNVSLLTGDSDKPYWRFKSGGEISRILPLGDHLLATSHDNFVYYITVGTGTVSWKKRLSGRVSQIGSLLGRFVLVSAYDEHSAVLTDLTNGKVAGQIAFAPDEILVASPISSNGIIFVLSSEAVYSFCLNGCPVNKEGGLGQETRKTAL